jgi:hypothetical protein
VNGMDGRLRDLLEAASGEPPHRVSVEAVHRRVIRRRVAEFTAGVVAVVAVAALVPVGIGALGHTHGPPTTGPAAARMVTSRHYGYTEALPAGWRLARQATRRWNGTGGPGYDRPVVDLFIGPGQVLAWAAAAPTNKSLTAFAAATIRASRAAHPCSPPQFDQAITIGGAPARLLGMQCAAGSGFLVEIAVTVRHGTGFVFASQNPPGATTATDRATERAAFRNFLAGIRLQQ